MALNEEITGLTFPNTMGKLDSNRDFGSDNPYSASDRNKLKKNTCLELVD
jgi:hypothetical protein